MSNFCQILDYRERVTKLKNVTIWGIVAPGVEALHVGAWWNGHPAAVQCC